ncbi:hypothetical protein GUJ93_ZPchr0001g30007 [Zizania palustris]|uniref:Uncharacterized protein n=1 Tax=Zizania palustris TaxID=103762 RepID=A0A8J5RWN9_ZIZPA|nr:hypothetical protein GUJ93_ZPchr0001g30007 [Zizania palustris]
MRPACDSTAITLGAHLSHRSGYRAPLPPIAALPPLLAICLFVAALCSAPLAPMRLSCQPIYPAIQRSTSQLQNQEGRARREAKNSLILSVSSSTLVTVLWLIFAVLSSHHHASFVFLKL